MLLIFNFGTNSQPGGKDFDTSELNENVISDSLQVQLQKINRGKSIGCKRK